MGNNKRDRAREQELIMQKWGRNPIIDGKNEETGIAVERTERKLRKKTWKRVAIEVRIARTRENKFAQSGAKWRDDAPKYCKNDGLKV